MHGFIDKLMAMASTPVRLANPQLAWLSLVWLALLIFLVMRLQKRRQLACLFAAEPLLSQLTVGQKTSRKHWRLYMTMAGLALAVLAMMGPLYGTTDEIVQSFGRDVMFVVDVSASMNAADYKPTRLEAARLELTRLIRQLNGNRLGLVGFAGMPVVFSPLTADSNASQLFLDGLDTKSVPVPGTVIGDAVRAAVERFPKGQPGGFIVLLTDGEDHHSDPLEAADLAAQRGIKILAVGIGTSDGGAVPDVLGGGGILTDDSGQRVFSRLDEATLQTMAERTGGYYTRLRPGSDCAGELVSEIERSEAKALAKQQERRMRLQFQWVLAMALGLILASRMIGERS